MLSEEIRQQAADVSHEPAEHELGASGCILSSVHPRDLLRSVQEAVDGLGARYMVSVGTDRREEAGFYEINHVFGLDRRDAFLVLRSEINPAEPAVPSITPVVPGAGWAEREIRDMIGVVPTGHPDPRRLVVPDDWPEDVFPLRKDFAFDERPPAVSPARPPVSTPPAGSTLLPIGPFFPTLEEPVFLNLFVQGEHITGVDYRGFYNHRGVEKLGDAALTYHQVPFIAERICGICGFVHSAAYCQAVEAAGGIIIPPRARYLRTILLELERVHSHLLWIGLACHFIGFDTLFMQAWRIREPVMWLTEFLTGNRKTYGMNQIGGVTRDLPADALERILPVLDKIAYETRRVVDAIVGDRSLRLRLQATGILTPEDAKAFCVIGPTARGSGVDIDARRDHPYAAYDDLAFDVCVEEGCDNWARTMVRIRELPEAIKIIRQALAGLPDGPVMAEVREIPAGRVAVSAVEAPRGEVAHYVLTGRGQRPERWRVRAPSYNNLQGVPAMLRGMTIADAPITVGSIDPCFSCTERLAVIDSRSGTRRIYRASELRPREH